jgi:hypothetical protein
MLNKVSLLEAQNNFEIESNLFLEKQIGGTPLVKLRRVVRICPQILKFTPKPNILIRAVRSKTARRWR